MYPRFRELLRYFLTLLVKIISYSGKATVVDTVDDFHGLIICCALGKECR